MTLGQKIFELRNQQKMSQGDLAEKLNVSRQSISKWETDASVPELDKLIMLSDLFHITIDELVRDELPEKRTDEERESTEKSSSETVVINKRISMREIIGFVLLIAGFFCLRPLLSLVGPRALILIAAFFILSAKCLLNVKYYLIIAWIITVSTSVILQIYTNISIIFLPYGCWEPYSPDWGTFFAVCIWVWIIYLIKQTVRAVKKRKLK